MFFHALTFVGSRGSCLNTRPIYRVFKHLPRDPANVNVMKHTCVIVILAYSTLFQPTLHRKRGSNITISIFLPWLSLNQIASAVNFRLS